MPCLDWNWEYINTNIKYLTSNKLKTKFIAATSESDTITKVIYDGSSTIERLVFCDLLYIGIMVDDINTRLLSPTAAPNGQIEWNSTQVMMRFYPVGWKVYKNMVRNFLI